MNEEGLIHLDLGIILRLPPLYLMDSLLGNNLGVSLEPSLQPVIEEQINMTEKISQSSDLYSTFTTLSGTSPALLILPHVVRFFLSSLLYLLSMFVFLLPATNLLVFYRYLVCALVIPASYASHKVMQDLVGERELVSRYPVLGLVGLVKGNTVVTTVLGNILVQLSLASVLRRLLKLPRNLPDLMSSNLALVMISPALLTSLSLPSSWVSWAAILSNLLPAILLGVSLGHQANRLLHHLHHLYTSKRQDIFNYGLNNFLEAEWHRLKVPSVLRMFWLSKMSFILIRRRPPLGLDVMKTALVTGSETLVSVLGMTSVISSISHWLGLMFQMMISSECEEEKSVASVSAVLFFVLALQTGLTGMESEKRFHQICKNLCLLLTAILHFVHTMVQPVLHRLSASRNTKKSSHLRVSQSDTQTSFNKFLTAGSRDLSISGHRSVNLHHHSLAPLHCQHLDTRRVRLLRGGHCQGPRHCPHLLPLHVGLPLSGRPLGES